MHKFLEKYNLPKLNEEEAQSLNRPVTPDEIETVIKKFPTHKSPGPDGFTGEFYRVFKGELTPNLLRLFNKFKKMEAAQTRFMKPTSPFLKKILPKRIQQYIKKIIHHDQVGFITGMQGQYNILKSINIIHHINNS